jgi:hypothetical protein
MFGVAEGLACPIGISPMKILTNEEAAEISKEYIKLFKKEV